MKLDKPLSLDFDDSPSTQSFQLTDNPGSTSVEALNKQVEQLTKELQAKNRLLDAKSQELSELKIINRQLEQTNRDTQERQKLLEEDLGKAEAQIRLIQELLLEEESDTSKEGIKSE